MKKRSRYCKICACKLECLREAELAKIRAEYGTKGGDDDYDPHKFRDIPHGTNFCETLTHVLKASLGTGILAMPQAFKYAGWVNGIIFTIVISGICTYGIHILIRSKYKLCKQLRVPYLAYSVAMRASLLSGPLWLSKYAYTSQIVVDGFLIIYQTGACCSYVIFVAENLKHLIDYYYSIDLVIEWYILATLVPFLFIMSVPNMKWLAQLSLLSNIISFVTFGILLCHILTGLQPFEKMDYIGPVRDFPLFIGIVLFAVAAMGAITTVEKNMAKPSQFTAPCGVINISMAVITIVYIVVGLLGYWRYPDDIKPSITLNLDEVDVKARIIQSLYAFAIYISNGLNGMVLVDIIWNNYLVRHLKDSSNPCTWEYLVRALIVLAITFLASVIPLLAEIISLSGSLCMSGLEIIFPAIVHLCVSWSDDFGWKKWILICDAIMILFGLVGLVSGTCGSIYNIVLKLRKKLF